jgi:hypothetical protein
MREHYDFSSGTRGKYAARYAEGSNVVVLDPDVADVFKDRESVNETLRAVVHLLDIQSRKFRAKSPSITSDARRRRRRSEPRKGAGRGRRG